MPGSSKHSDRPNTLPLPELNPLLNPLLGENMGRWAEVYFRTPPENREQAVLELLQELERKNAGRKGEVTSPRWTTEQGLTQDGTPSLQMSGAPGSSAENPTSMRTQPSDTPHVIHCRVCGHVNASEQRFCGMCGVSLLDHSATSPAPVLETSSATKQHGDELPAYESQSESSNDSEMQEETASPSPAYGFLGLQDVDRLRAKRATQEEFLHSLDYPPPGRPYRAYIGAILAVLIGALGYVAWKSAKTSGSSPLATQVPPSAVTQSAEESPPPPAQKAAALASESSTETSHGAAEMKEHEPQPAAASSEKLRPVATAPSESVPAARVPSPPPTASSGGTGAEELAIAKNYLNAAGGHQADSAEAIDWLWKSVAKRNVEATMLLSDLYLRGTGIAKNCDQARVLLDAAASRGIKEAAVRLRNMQAFGCQ